MPCETPGRVAVDPLAAVESSTGRDDFAGPRRQAVSPKQKNKMKLDAENKARVAFAVFLLLLAAGALGWYLLAAGRYTLYQIRTNDPVSGLIPDAPVEYHGVDVGKVERVDLIDSRSIRVVLAIREDAPVSAATVATITSRGVATRGFTGYVYVSLEDAGTDTGRLVAPPGEPYPTIPTAASKSMSLDLLISQLNDNVQSLTELVHGLLDRDTVAALKESAGNLRQVTRTLADNSARLNVLIANGEAASRRLQPLLQSGQQTVDALQPLLRSSQDTVDAMRPLIRSSQDTVDALQLQLVPQVYRVLTQVDDLAVSLDGLADKVGKDPMSVVRGSAARRPGPGERQ